MADLNALFGKIAVRIGVCSQADVDAARAEVRRRTGVQSAFVGQFLVDCGKLDELGLERVLASLTHHLRVDAQHGGDLQEDYIFGQICMSSKLATEVAISDAMREQTRAKDEGFYFPLPALLVRAGALKAHYVEKVMDAQVSKSLTCSNCGTSFFLNEITPGDAYVCKSCKEKTIAPSITDRERRKQHLLSRALPDVSAAKAAELESRPLVPTDSAARFMLAADAGIAEAIPVDLATPREALPVPLVNFNPDDEHAAEFTPAGTAAETMPMGRPAQPSPQAAPTPSSSGGILPGAPGLSNDSAAAPQSTVPTGDVDIRELAGHLFANCRLEAILGQGGMSVVYAAQNVKLDKPVAIKIMSQELSQYPDFVEMFHEEAKMAAGLEHPNIVQVLDFGVENGLYYLVMPMIVGESLRGKLDGVGRLDVDDGLRIMKATAAALDFAHRRGIIHRDVKPENILITPKNEVKVTDFGLGARIDPENNAAPRVTAAQGTPRFMAPEQVQGGTIDERADLYSLGATFYLAFTGEYAIDGKTLGEVLEAHQKRPVVPPQKVRSSIPARLSKLLMTLLAKRPVDRYPNATVLVRDITALLQQVESGEPEPTAIRRASGGPVKAPPRKRDTTRRTATPQQAPSTDGLMFQLEAHERYCPRCKTIIRKDAADCFKCHLQFCTNCGAPTKPDDLDCRKCGTDLGRRKGFNIKDIFGGKKK